MNSNHDLPISMKCICVSATCHLWQSGTNANVAIFQYKIMIMVRKETPRVIRPLRIQI